MKSAAPVSRTPLPGWGVHALAIFALLIQLMLPVAAFATASGPAGARVPVCTGIGIVWMDVGSESSATDTGDTTTTVHCPICFATAAPALSVPAPDIALPWQVVAVVRGVPQETGAMSRPALIRAPPCPVPA